MLIHGCVQDLRAFFTDLKRPAVASQACVEHSGDFLALSILARVPQLDAGLLLGHGYSL